MILRLARAVLVLAALAALVLLAVAVTGTAPALTLGTVDLGPLGPATVGVSVGLVPAFLLVLVTGLGAVVASYAVRNLAGQRRLGRFAALEVLAIGALALAVTAQSLPLLALGWTTAGLALAALVAHAGTPSARAAAGRVRTRLLVGDAALWAAVATAGVGLGALDLATLPAAVADGPGPVVAAAALLVVVAGLVRSALVPAHRWLPETAEAPSPVSALLHAGLVNGVGVLALLLWPLLSTSAPARAALLVAGVATVLLATGQQRTRPDVKGRLAASTSAQMGYLSVTAALGLPVAVLAHVLGHGAWKAGLFLGAGGTVERVRATAPHGGGSGRSGGSGQAGSRARATTVAIVLATVAVVGAAVVPGPWGDALVAGPAELLPLAVAVAAGALGVRAALASPAGGRVAAGLAVSATLAAVAGYVLGLRALGRLLHDVAGWTPAGWGAAEAPALAAAVAGLLALAVGAWWVDRRLRAGAWPGLAAAVARTSLPAPRSARVSVTGAAQADASSAPPQCDPARVRREIRRAAAVVAPSWPLTSFVASNPLAGLEDRPFDEAVAEAAAAWGARTGPGAASLRAAVRDGRVDPDLAAQVLAGAGLDLDPDLSAVPGTDRPDATEVVLALLSGEECGPAPLQAARQRLHRGPDADPAAGSVLADALAALPRPAAPVTAPLDRLAGSDAAARARVVASWCAAQALGRTGWPVAGGPWRVLRASTTRLDRALGVRGAGALVGRLPAEPESAVAVLLDRLAGPTDDDARVTLVARVLARDPGWPAHLAWRRRQRLAPTPDRTDADATGDPLGAPDVLGPLAPDLAEPIGPADAGADPDLAGLLAVRLALEAAVGEAYGVVSTAPAAPLPAAAVSPGADGAARALADGCGALGLAPNELDDRGVAAVLGLVGAVDRVGRERLRLLLLEQAVRRDLLPALADRARDLRAGGGSALVHPLGSDAGPAGPDAQVVTCIDVRSERLRRQLEWLGPWETLGIAGFFGLPMRHVGPGGTTGDRAPALLRPGWLVAEDRAPAPAAAGALDRLRAAVHDVEARPFVPFALAEASGWLIAPAALLRTWAAGWWARLTARSARRWSLPRRGQLRLLADPEHPGTGFAPDELVAACAGFLRTVGLHRPAPLVVLCGHGGSAANHPHVAAYDCGACGGWAGDVSARALAQALNLEWVRDRLWQHGFEIDAGTRFVAAVHDTTRDRVELLEPEAGSDPALARLAADLDRAAEAAARERAGELAGARPTAGTSSVRRLRRQLDARAADWSQAFPEWGLAGNAALVVGPRALTAGLDLRGRVFLHSYRPDLDADGAVLETLLTAPLVVAQWINAQYWCATVDPARFGAGDKTTHNVLASPDGAPAPLSGVLTGAAGDLRIGLPWQAVSDRAPGTDGFDAAAPVHEPVRLLAVVCAGTDAIDAVLARHEGPGRLVEGRWLTLVSLGPEDGRLRRRLPGGRWVPAATDPRTAGEPRWGDDLVGSPAG
ncbi:MAG: putative inorganic carbon transporter subunit DabA [Candidatus Nanopelagicales bacterium]